MEPRRYAAGTPCSRASTSFLRLLSKEDVDGRDKPGHDSGEVVRYGIRRRSDRGVSDALSHLQVFALGLGKRHVERQHKGGGAHALTFWRQPRRGRAVVQGERGAAKAM